jgi:hypothetical protein
MLDKTQKDKFFKTTSDYQNYFFKKIKIKYLSQNTWWFNLKMLIFNSNTFFIFLNAVNFTKQTKEHLCLVK